MSEIAKVAEERDNLGMRVWIPSRNLAEAKCKEHPIHFLIMY